MEILKIKRSGEPSLANHSVEIRADHITGAFIRSVIRALNDFIVSNDIEVLSAPVIGHNISLIVISPKSHLYSIFGNALINPEISMSDNLVDHPEWESSITLPGIEFCIFRPESVMVSCFNIDGGRVDALVSGSNARILLQQVDHLQGITPLCRVKDLTLGVRPKPSDSN